MREANRPILYKENLDYQLTRIWKTKSAGRLSGIPIRTPAPAGTHTKNLIWVIVPSNSSGARAVTSGGLEKKWQYTA